MRRLVEHDEPERRVSQALVRARRGGGGHHDALPERARTRVRLTLLRLAELARERGALARGFRLAEHRAELARVVGALPAERAAAYAEHGLVLGAAPARARGGGDVQRSRQHGRIHLAQRAHAHELVEALVEHGSQQTVDRDVGVRGEKHAEIASSLGARARSRLDDERRQRASLAAAEGAMHEPHGAHRALAKRDAPRRLDDRPQRSGGGERLVTVQTACLAHRASRGGERLRVSAHFECSEFSVIRRR